MGHEDDRLTTIIGKLLAVNVTSTNVDCISEFQKKYPIRVQICIYHQHVVKNILHSSVYLMLGFRALTKGLATELRKIVDGIKNNHFACTPIKSNESMT